MTIDAATRAQVWRRASDRCEYCGLLQIDSPFRTFHIDHIIARKHGGSDQTSNLALACDRCSLHKSSDLSGIDTETGQLAPLFNPRTQLWSEHFVAEGARIRGLTSTGRVTVSV